MMSSWTIMLLGGALLVASWSASCNASADTHGLVDSIKSRALFFETFDDDSWKSRWKHSDDAKYNGRFTTEAGNTWTNNGLKIPEKNKYYGLTALLPAPVDPIVAAAPEPLSLVVQYEVKYSGGITCGGAYLKLLSADADLAPEGLVDSTPYSIMFGPDRCGGPGKVHLILRHRNPVNGTVTEKHLASAPVPESNDLTHIYTLRLFPDHRYEVLVDGAVKSSGSLMDPDTLQPPLLPSKTIPDPEDTKPASWVDEAKITDPDAEKPDDWDDRPQVEDESAVKPKGWLEDEPEFIDDPTAKRPSDWDEEEDGVWEPNQISNPRCRVGCGAWKRPLKANPAFKGAWKPPLIDNPDYKGPWIQSVIPNPHFFEEAAPLTTGVAPIGGVALELWTVDSGYMFDNLLITRDPGAAEAALSQLWKPRHEAEVKASEAAAKELEKVEEDRKRAEKAEKRKGRKKRQKGGRRGDDQLQQLVDSVLDLFEDGAVLAPLRPALAPLLDFISDQPANAMLVVTTVPLMVLSAIMVLRVFGGRRDGKGTKGGEAAAAEAEGTEAPPAAEGEAAGALAAEGEAAAGEGEGANGRGEPGEGDTTNAPTGEATEEITATGEDEDEDEEPTTGARRRVRRAA